MYSYKLNNSYTVYVDYAYLNDCIKASKKKSVAASTKTYLAPPKKEKSVFTPLATNTMLSHKTFGCGKVVSTDKKGVMSVAFRNRVAKFIYPDAMEQGFLVLVH